MRELLQQVIAEIEKLPAEQQDAVATHILAELADEQAWASRFNATTEEQWERLAEAARREIAAGDTTPLDDVFPLMANNQEYQRLREELARYTAQLDQLCLKSFLTEQEKLEEVRLQKLKLRVKDQMEMLVKRAQTPPLTSPRRDVERQ